MADTLKFETHPGRFQAIIISLVGFGILSLGITSVWPWYVCVMWAAVTLSMMWIISSTGRAGVRIDAKNLSFWVGRHRRIVPLDQIDHVRVTHPIIGDDTAAIYFCKGDNQMLPQNALPPTEDLTMTLMAHGIRVKKIG